MTRDGWIARLTALAAGLRGGWMRSGITADEHEEIAQLLQLDPILARVVDNHHNAATCPYCRPDMEEQVGRMRALAARVETLRIAFGGVDPMGLPVTAIESKLRYLVDRLNRQEQK